MAVKHIDNSNGQDLKVPYARVQVSVEKVFVDEQHPQKTEGPNNVHLNTENSELQSLATINKAFRLLGIPEVEDQTGTTPKLKSD